MSRFSDSDHRRLEATVLPDCVVESHQVSDTARGLRRVQVTKLWRTERVLGHGAFGEVLLQALDNDYQAAAVFVDFFGWFQNPNDRSMYLAMEFMREGDLEANLLDLEASTEHGLAIPEEEVREITSQILEGLKIMHIEGFAHRDLKPKNIFVVQRKPEWWMKLGDFGLTKRQTEETVYRTQAGTMQYMGPELYFYVPGLNDETSEYTNAVDIWALGCIVYRILTRTVPFPSLLSLRNYSNSSGDLLFGVPYPMVEAEAFVRELLSPHPAKRPSASAGLEHSWVVPKKERAKKIFEYTSANSVPENTVKSPGAYNTVSHPGLQSYNSPLETTDVSVSSLIQVPALKPIGPPEVKAERSAGSHISPIFSGQRILKAPKNEAITLIEYSKRKLSARSMLQGYSSGVGTIVISPDGQLLASGFADETIKLWDLATDTMNCKLEFHQGAYCVAISPDGLCLAFVSSDMMINFYSLVTHKMHKTPSGHSNGTCFVAFSPDGRFLASGSQDNTVKLLDLATGAVHRTFTGYYRPVYSVAFSPDSQFLASTSRGEPIKIWNLTTSKAQSLRVDHSNYATSIAFSPDGRILASGHPDNTIKLWDLAAYTVYRTLSGHSRGVSAVAFSPDGQLVASGSWDNTIKLWDLATGTVHSTIELFVGNVSSIAFSPDGQSLASGSSYGTVRLWDITQVE